jgi:hypothetical protein
MTHAQRHVGERHGRLTLIRHVGMAKKNYIWECRCDCGNVIKAQYSNISRRTKSCGCLLRETGRNKTHGMSFTPIYQAWATMISRCHNPAVLRFNDYGGRGIFVCDRWRKFDNFYSDMGDRPVGKSIDRIDNNLGYFKENCRWATPEEQNRNRRYCKYITINGETKTLNEWALQNSISPTCIEDRMRRGLSAENAIFLKPWDPLARTKRKIGNKENVRKKLNAVLVSG